MYTTDPKIETRLRNASPVVRRLIAVMSELFNVLGITLEVGRDACSIMAAAADDAIEQQVDRDIRLGDSKTKH